MYKKELHAGHACFVKNIFSSCLMAHVLSVPVYGLEEVDSEKRSQNLLAQDIGKQHSSFPSFWRKFIMEEDVLCYIAISDLGTKKSFCFAPGSPHDKVPGSLTASSGNSTCDIVISYPLPTCTITS